MRNRLLVTGCVMILVWLVFKSYYPYADFFVDSYSYIEAAVNKDAIGYRPIGYSIFLRLVHAVSSSDTFLVTLQYLLVQSACLVLFVRMQRICRPAAWVSWLVLAFLALNPLIPYTCNYVSSDALFIGLSLFWFNLLIGLILRPSWWRIGVQLLLLVLIFNIRYVALYYPAVAAIAFFLMRKDLFFKIAGIAASIAVVIAGTFWVKSITRRKTGASIFSAFSGWQIANNALHIYPFIPVDTAGLPSMETKILSGYVRHYFDSCGASLQRRGPSSTTAYMWEENSPLHQYMTDYQHQGSLSYWIAWNRVATVFTEYGYYLVRKHPSAFGRYYIWNSAGSFFVTSLDVYAVYNEGKKEIDPIAQGWFLYRSRPEVRSATIQAKLLAPMPYFSIILNIFFVVTALLYLRVRALRNQNPAFTLCFRLACAYLLANACFCIFASPSVFRYQVLPMILLFVFTIYGIHFVTFHYGPKSSPRKLRL